ncbi:MAG: ATP synthase subunit I [Syntrophales bacterium]|nr:ATP synthase subunit I [Syntrophales bacterium]MCK9527802.1 ATP synthase subunit I [Syntrophales bacterium]MDX9922101.1 ATP synthase subunit I [Syntrophales bacterium]
MKKIELRSWIVVAAVSVICFIFASLPVAFGILIGGTICSLNFQWMYRDAKRALEGSVDKAPRRVIARFYLRLVVTAVVLFVVITRTSVNVIALVVGLSMVMLTIIPTVLLENQKNFSQEVK